MRALDQFRDNDRASIDRTKPNQLMNDRMHRVCYMKGGVVIKCVIMNEQQMGICDVPLFNETGIQSTIRVRTRPVI